MSNIMCDNNEIQKLQDKIKFVSKQYFCIDRNEGLYKNHYIVDLHIKQLRQKLQKCIYNQNNSITL